MADNPFSQFRQKLPRENPFARFRQQAAAQGVQQSNDKNFFQRVGDRFDERYQKGEKIADSYVRGQQSMGETILQHGGQGAAFGGDILVEGLKSVGTGVSNVTPDFIEDPIKKAAKYGLDSIVDSTPGRAAAEAIGSAVQGYQNFAKDNPRAARNLEAAANIGLSVLPVIPVKGTSGASAAATVATRGSQSVAQAAGAGARGVADLAGDAARALNTRTIIPNADEIRTVASAAYKRADDLGGTLSPHFTNRFLDQARKILSSGDETIDAMRSNAPLRAAIEDLEAFRNQPMSLRRAQALDEQLGNMIDSHLDAGRLTKPGKALHDVQSAFREMIEKADSSVISGGQSGFKSLDEGRKLWSASRRMEDIERIIQRASMTDNPATAIRSGFRNLALDKKRMGGFSQAEQEAIKKAAGSGVVSDLLRTAGSRLVPIVTGAAGGGVSGTAAAAAASAASRGAASKLAVNRAKGVAREVANRAGLSRQEPRFGLGGKKAAPEVLPEPMLALPSPTSARPMTPDQISAAQRAMNQTAPRPPASASGTVSHDYGDVPYNYHGMTGQKAPLALPAPEKAIVPSQGGLRWQTPAEVESGIIARQRAEELGSTMDIRGAQAARTASKQEAARQSAYSKALGQLEAEKAVQMEAGFSEMSPTTRQMVADALRRQQELTDAIGPQTNSRAMHDALVKALMNRR